VEKKLHTIKNIILSDINKKILFLSETYEGSTHDKAICDEEDFHFPKYIRLWIDNGFEGLNPDDVEIQRPKRKPRKKEFTLDDKLQNKEISRVRVKVEHAIGFCKIFRIVKDEIRAYKDNFRDLVLEIACALANFKLKFVLVN
jgi:hypothetical protein